MRIVLLTLCLWLTACIPGATPPGERGGDSSPTIPTEPGQEETPEEIQLPDVSYNPVGRQSVETTSNTANVFNYDPGSYSYTLSGVVSIETVGMDTEGKLKYDDTTLEPLRSGKIQLVDVQTDALVAETFVTDGAYQFLINERRLVYLRLIAESENPTIKVKDNIGGNQTYQYETDYFDLVNNPIRNFVINVGFNVSLFYANSHLTGSIPGDPDFLGGSIEDSFSAPFGILNNYYAMLTQVHTQMAQTGRISQSALDQKTLNIFWNPNNEASIGSISEGEIGKAHYNPLYPGIFLKGQVNVDTDEWDYYLQAKLLGYHILNDYSRREFYSMDYDENKILQPGQLFPHVFAQIFSAKYTTQAPNFYRESGGLNGQTLLREIDFNNNLLTNRDWYQFEGTRKFLWDLFDGINEGLDYSSLSDEAMFDVLLDPDFKQDSHPVNLYKFIHHLKENNPNDRIFIDHLGDYYHYEEDWGPYGPETTDADLPSSYSEFNPLLKPFPEILIDDGTLDSDPVAAGLQPQPFNVLSINKNNGECSVVGSESYLRFYPISLQTKVELVRTDLITVEVLREGRVVWASSNNENETFLLDTPDATLSGNVEEDESPFYIIKARSHPGASANTATLSVRLHTNHALSPLDNISNQFIVYTIGLDAVKTFSVPSYVNRCHDHATIGRYKFQSIPENNVRLFLRFNTQDEVEYKVLIDDEVVITNNTGGVRDQTHILNYNDTAPQTDRKMEIHVENKYNLFEDFSVNMELEYLPY